MIDIADNNQSLKKRVIRFFESPKRADVLDFIKSASLVGEVLVFGGLLRDIALFGVKNFNSDIDLVVDCAPSELFSFFNECMYKSRRNKFGGYRVEIAGWTVDVWPIRETWAFKNDCVMFENRESLLLTTITNWDAIAFSFEDKQIIAASSYLECLKIGELDIVMEYNPNPTGVLMRIIRSICDRQAQVLMPKIVKYLKRELPKWSATQIVSAQVDMLGKIYLSEFEYYNFRDEVFSLEEDLFGSSVLLKGRNFSLPFFE